MKTVAIFGVGLIGGSFALALREAGFGGVLAGVSSPATLRRALELGVIDRAQTAEEAAREADLLYLAQPIHQILETIPSLQAWTRPESLITDAGSTKSAVMECARRHLPRRHFLGGHPMAGKERSGVEAADANLFRDRKYILTPRPGDDLDAPPFAGFRQWLERIGAIPVVATAEGHDCAVASSSHLPQLAATALASALAANGDDFLPFAGPGLLDSTRLALSPFPVWRDIFATNKQAIQGALERYIDTLWELHRSLDSTETGEHFERAAAFARRLRE